MATDFWDLWVYEKQLHILKIFKSILKSRDFRGSYRLFGYAYIKILLYEQELEKYHFLCVLIEKTNQF